MDVARTPDERFTDLPDYPFEPNYVTVGSDIRLHYVDVGPKGGRPVLLLHGQPTWSYLYRKVIPELTAGGHRAIAPDFIGFGRSDKPCRRAAYSVRGHTRWLLDFLDTIGLTGITLVVQDWGGPIGLGALAEVPERFAGVVAANTALHTADASLAGALTWACHTMSDGRVAVEPALLDYQRMTQEVAEFRPSHFLQGATQTEVPSDVLDAYDAPFPDETFCAGARQLPVLMGLTPGSECARQNRRTLDALRTFDGPLLTAFSDGDPATQGWEAVLRGAAAGAAGQTHTVIEGAGHFLQEDDGPALGRAVATFVSALPG
jgi:haloalkane dehalogenase